MLVNIDCAAMLHGLPFLNVADGYLAQILKCPQQVG
jgi:hypothetical protein